MMGVLRVADQRVEDHNRARKGSSSDAVGTGLRWVTAQAPVVLFMAAVAFLAFVGGAMVTLSGAKPAG